MTRKKRRFLLILLVLSILAFAAGCAALVYLELHQGTASTSVVLTHDSTVLSDHIEKQITNTKNELTKRTAGWQKRGDNWVYFGEDHQLKYGWLEQSGHWYYLRADASMSTGWGEVDGNWYFFDSEGIMKTGWVKDGGTYFYMNSKGAMQTGWIADKGKWYHLNTDGIMQTGWVEDSTGRYYMDPSGAMTTGWITDQGTSYYMNTDGTMAHGWIVVNGQNFYLQNNGVYDPDTPPVLDSIPDNSKGPRIALTFDDGPSQYTDRLLDSLEKNHAKATFFMLGNLVPKYPDAVKRMQKLGCELGNHSYDHADLGKKDAKGIKSEIADTNKNIKAVAGKNATVMRPPYGSYNDLVKANVGMPMIMWSLDTLDWQTLDKQATIDAVLNTVKDGDIILMHDIHSTSVDAAQWIIPALVERGYQLVTVSELAKAKSSPLKNGTAYGSFY